MKFVPWTPTYGGQSVTIQYLSSPSTKPLNNEWHLKRKLLWKQYYKQVIIPISGILESTNEGQDLSVMSTLQDSSGGRDGRPLFSKGTRSQMHVWYAHMCGRVLSELPSPLDFHRLKQVWGVFQRILRIEESSGFIRLRAFMKLLWPLLLRFSKGYYLSS